jgi:hypothetical protein
MNGVCRFSSKDKVNQWVQWDFHDHRVNPTHYSIHTHNSPCTGPFLKSWVIEGSTDGSDWRELDRQTNNNDLNGSHLIRSF